MARYIDVETALKIIDNYAKTVTADGIVVVKAIRDIVEIITPTADVVPKSEVDLYRKQVDELEDELASTYDKLENAKAEIETLKDNNEHLAVMLEETKAQKDELIKNYAECMKDYAREIFVEIEKEIDRGLSVIEKILNTKGGRANGKTVLISKYEVYREAKKYIAELKKKYTEGEDKPAATEEKYFSPEDVRNMTHQEVREKYSAIRKSMEMW